MRFLSPVLVLAILALPLAASAEGVEPKALFLDSKCSTCHSVAAADIARKLPESTTTGPELTGLEVEDPAALKAFLRREQNRNGRRHGIKVKLTDEQLDAILAWLRQL